MMKTFKIFLILGFFFFLHRVRILITPTATSPHHHGNNGYFSNIFKTSVEVSKINRTFQKEKKKEKSAVTMNDDKETSSFSAQIQSLEEELQRCRLQCKTLKSENSLLSAQSCRLEEDRRDIDQFLLHHSAELEKKLQEQQEQQELQQLTHTQELQALKLQLHQEKLQLQEKRDLLSSEVTQQAARMKEQQEELKQQLKEELPSVEQLLQLRSKIQSADQQLCFDLKKHEEEETEKINRLLQSRLPVMMAEKREELREVKEKAKLLLEQNKALFKEKSVLQVSLENFCSDVDEVKANVKKDSLQILSLRKDVHELRWRMQLLKSKKVRTLQSALQMENTPRKPVISPMKHQRQTAPPAVEGAQQQRRTKAFETAETPPPINMTNSHRPPRAQIYQQKLLEILERRDHQSPSH